MMPLAARRSVEDRFSFLGTLAWGDRGRTAAEVFLPSLQGLAAAVGETVTALAGICVLSPVFEVKVVAGLALQETAEAYCALAGYLDEAGSAPRRRAADPLQSDDLPWPRVAFVAEQSLPGARAAAARLADSLDRLSDWPLVRLIERQVLPSLDAAADSLGGLRRQLGEAAEELGSMAERDPRYQTFDCTRDYRSRRDYGDRPPDESGLVAQVRTQRDELDAIETFARVVASSASLSATDLLALARVVGDESRHTLMGELGLSMLGLDPVEVPIGTIGADLRRRLDPWEGLAQICLIGESGNLREIEAAAGEAVRLGQSRLAVMLRAIYRDERRHIALGVRLLSSHFPGPSPAELRAVALANTNRYLSARGMAPVDAADAARLFGE